MLEVLIWVAAVSALVVLVEIVIMVLSGRSNNDG